jgi:hypothetical protein
MSKPLPPNWQPIGEAAAAVVVKISPHRGLSVEQLAAREGKLTASRVACLMTGNEAEIIALWREMIGDPGFVPEDLSGVWPVQLGSATEQVNLDWYERRYGPVTRRGEVVTHAVGWAACTLDGWDATRCYPVETKHCGGHEPVSLIIERYQPQMQWQMLVTRAPMCALSIIMGAREPVVEFIEADLDYQAELWRRAEVFMHHVYAMTPPVALAPAAPPVIAEKTYDMASSNAWGEHAAVWLANIEGKKLAEKADKELKALVPADAIKCHGHGIVVRRDRAGRLALREQKEEATS